MANRIALNGLMQASSAYQGEYRAILEGYEISTSQLSRDEIYLAEVSGQVAGFYSLVTHAGEAELDLFFVANERQGSGIGKRLFGHMVKRARNLGFDKVLIVAHPPASGFYIRMGAVQIDRREPHGRVVWERPVFQLKLADWVV